MRRQSTLGSLGSSGKPVEAGRPGLVYTVRHTEAGLCWSRFYIKAGSPTMREAHSKNYIDVEAGLCRMPYWVYKGSPTEREAR